MVKRSKQARQTKSVRLPSPGAHLSSEAFLKKADKLWQSGPIVKYKNPDSWQRKVE